MLWNILLFTQYVGLVLSCANYDYVCCGMQVLDNYANNNRVHLTFLTFNSSEASGISCSKFRLPRKRECTMIQWEWQTQRKLHRDNLTLLGIIVPTTRALRKQPTPVRCIKTHAGIISRNENQKKAFNACIYNICIFFGLLRWSSQVRTSTGAQNIWCYYFI